MSHANGSAVRVGRLASCLDSEATSARLQEQRARWRVATHVVMSFPQLVHMPKY